MKIILFNFLFHFLCSLNLYSQDGKLSGKVFDEKTRKPLPLAEVHVLKNKVVKAGTITNTNGMYLINNLPPGEYQLAVSYVSYEKKIVESVVISHLKTSFLDIPMGKPSDNKKKELKPAPENSQTKQ